MAVPQLSRDVVSKKIISFSMSESPTSRRLNTGVLVIGQRLLSPLFRRDLIDFAQTREFGNEQSALRTFLYETGRGNVRMISPVYNFKAAFLEKVSAGRRFGLLSKIAFLHFAGEAVRPWEKSTPETTSDVIWFGYNRDAVTAYEEANITTPA
jgi:hypothetical protein